jgi:hypothetical protein
MIKPDQQAAIKKIKHLHDALDGVMMGARNGGFMHNLAFVLQAELRYILRLLGEED